ncbi:ASCH domain-containing protein [Ramlibacter sp. AN1133]|uniref:ASCH domain-containing protein n=1 Tax=Ramlibacter sp. AN1133 TaxID=3133429 RepID=UPI0030BF5203
MAVPARLASFWATFLRRTGRAEDAPFYEAFAFGDTESLANGLAELVLREVKRATAGSAWTYEAQGKSLPKRGDLSIVTDWAGTPLCVIETEAVDVVPFGEVCATFAAIEGEGDGSLSFWREAHRQYFTRECIRIGRLFSEDMPVACERFRVVYRPCGDAA